MLYLLDSITWEEIRQALIFDTPLKERRAIAMGVDPEPMVKMCGDCTRGRMPHEQMVWGLFKDDKLCHIVFDEETAYKFVEQMRGYERRAVRVGWK